MADTSELLRICDEMLYGVPTGDETLGHIKDCCTLARALKSRLQAEAPEDAEVARIIGGLEDNISVTKDKRDWYEYAHCVERVTQEAIALIRTLQSRTSQAEAQAPTTAASVLTEDEDAAREHLQTRWEKYPEGTLNIPVDRDDLGTVLAALERVALTVGAPAPAPTMPTREETPK